jgi:hypothetical protein
LYRLFNIGADSALIKSGQPFIWLVSDCKHYPCHDFPNLESLLQDYFALFRGLTIYVIWKYKIKFKFLSAALAGLFLSFSAVVDAAPVRYNLDGSGVRDTKVSGYVVVDAFGSLAGDDLFDVIRDWSFEWEVEGDVFVRSAGGASRLTSVAPSRGFRLTAGGLVAESSGFRVEADGATCAVGAATSNCLVLGFRDFGTMEFLAFADPFSSQQFADSYIGAFTWSAPVPVPEPSSLALVALGIMGLALRRFKKQS